MCSDSPKDVGEVAICGSDDTNMLSSIGELDRSVVNCDWRNKLLIVDKLLVRFL